MKNFLGTKYTAAKCVIVCLVLILFTYVIDDFWITTNYIFYKNIVLIILPTIASIVGVSAVWEIFGKRSFSREVLNLANVSDNLIDSGIIYVYKDFKNIDWNEELRGVNKLIMFFTYGNTFRNQNKQVLESFSAKNKDWTVVLPNFNDKKIIDELDRRFCYGTYDPRGEKESVEKQIQKAIRDFIEMGAKIKLYNGTICSSYYLMDEICIFAPFKHGYPKSYVPAFKCSNKLCSNGTLVEFCFDDMSRILENSIDYIETGVK